MNLTILRRTIMPVALLAMAASANALTITESATAPTDFILGQPDFSATSISNEDYSNQIPPGQTFTTSQAFSLDGVTLKGFGSSGDGGLSFDVIISSVSGTTLTHLTSETANFSPSFDNNTDYVTFTLSNPVSLAANTQYAFTIYSNGSSYYGFAKSSTDVLPGGSAFDEGSVRSATTSGDQIESVQGVDRTFFLEGTDVPEPSTWALMLGGVVLLVTWTRRRLLA
jgi:hypothetical protein